MKLSFQTQEPLKLATNSAVWYNGSGQILLAKICSDPFSTAAIESPIWSFSVMSQLDPHFLYNFIFL